jgi:phage/plasmid-associated DNA primase
MDCLTTGDGMRATLKDIYNRYQEWAKESGTDAMSKKALGQRLRRRFGEPVRDMHGQIYNGVGVRMHYA